MTAAEECANGFPEYTFIATKAMKTTNGERLNDGLSLLNPFGCDGTLSGLVLGVDVRTVTASRRQYPEISLWRPRESDDEDDDGNHDEYRLVQGSKRTVQLTPDNFSTSGAFEYVFDVPLDFRADDILGWMQPGDKASVVRMYTIDGSSFMLTRMIPRSMSTESISLEDSKSSNNVLLLYPVTGQFMHAPPTCKS